MIHRRHRLVGTFHRSRGSPSKKEVLVVVPRGLASPTPPVLLGWFHERFLRGLRIARDYIWGQATGLKDKRGCGRNLGGFCYEDFLFCGRSTSCGGGVSSGAVCD